MPVNNNIFSVDKGLPLEVFIDKYSRLRYPDDIGYQSWEERITDVVNGNFTLDPRVDLDGLSGDAALEVIQAVLDVEYKDTLKYAKKGIISMSGRHLQHGDLDQRFKTGELFTNCSSAVLSFVKFYLLLKGSGVGRSYDSDACWTDWDYLPHTRFVLSSQHPDYNHNIESLEEAQHKYDSDGEDVRWFTVDDSAEGWVKVVSILETAAFHKNNRDHLFIFDFSKVRGKGVPIRGQQGRPSSGPVPLIEALIKVSTIKGAGYKPWKQALFIDHYLSACVAVGGVRRSARLAIKYWKDRDIIDFIDVKRGGWLYTANNSIAVDAEFWEQARDPRPSHARRVFEAAVSAAYYDNTGEPGFINVDRLTWSDKGKENISAENYFNKEYEEIFGGIHYKTKKMIAYTLNKTMNKKYCYIPNPCVEINFALYGAYCTVADACIMNADTEEEAIAAVSSMGIMLARTNRMKFLYQAEVKRTNRIGISLIGIHEFAAKFYDYDFYDLLDEQKSEKFWNFIDRLRITVTNKVNAYCDMVGMERPHTHLTLKPAGTVAKVMNCTEAANLPSMPYYLRFVQFKAGHPLLEEYVRRGYPVRDISKAEKRTDKVTGKEFIVNGYRDTFIVGFPTKPPITEILGDRVVCAGDISVEQHYQWLQLLEKHWLGGEGKNNQLSYTLKYDPANVKFEEFRQIILDNQPKIRCCAVMPQIDTSAYIYTPEERITGEQYDQYMTNINRMDREAVDESTLSCEGGACGIDFSKNGSIADVAVAQAAE